MSSIIVIVAAVVYVALYFLYGKKLETNVVKANDAIETPASRLFDGVDYIPAKTPVLFGHHFASVAGAAPIVGPVIAMAWGWLPSLAWIWFGNIFIGAVHDYLAIMASVRYDGKSIQFVASDLITKRTGQLFYWLVFMILILIVGAFAAVIGGLFLSNPAIPTNFVLLLISSVDSWSPDLPCQDELHPRIDHRVGDACCDDLFRRADADQPGTRSVVPDRDVLLHHHRRGDSGKRSASAARLSEQLPALYRAYYRWPRGALGFRRASPLRRSPSLRRSSPAASRAPSGRSSR
jgi:hypothetical protein